MRYPKYRIGDTIRFPKYKVSLGCKEVTAVIAVVEKVEHDEETNQPKYITYNGDIVLESETQ